MRSFFHAVQFSHRLSLQADNTLALRRPGMATQDDFAWGAEVLRRLQDQRSPTDAPGIRSGLRLRPIIWYIILQASCIGNQCHLGWSDLISSRTDVLTVKINASLCDPDAIVSKGQH